MLFGKGHLDLPERIAIAAVDAGNGEDDGGVLATEGQRAEASLLAALLPNVGRLAVWTGEFVGTDRNKKLDAARYDLLPEVGIAANAVHVIQ